jgi:hypothetical protein
MRKLRIDLYDPRGKLLKTIIAGHVDACRSMTIISESFLYFSDKKPFDYTYHCPWNLEHSNIIEGIITLYYKHGYFMEISRIGR